MQLNSGGCTQTAKIKANWPCYMGMQILWKSWHEKSYKRGATSNERARERMRVHEKGDKHTTSMKTHKKTTGQNVVDVCEEHLVNFDQTLNHLPHLQNCLESVHTKDSLPALRKKKSICKWKKNRMKENISFTAFYRQRCTKSGGRL